MYIFVRVRETMVDNNKRKCPIDISTMSHVKKGKKTSKEMKGERKDEEECVRIYCLYQLEINNISLLSH